MKSKIAESLQQKKRLKDIILLKRFYQKLLNRKEWQFVIRYIIVVYCLMTITENRYVDFISIHNKNI